MGRKENCFNLATIKQYHSVINPVTRDIMDDSHDSYNTEAMTHYLESTWSTPSYALDCTNYVSIIIGE